MSKWIAEFDLEDGDTMPEHMDLQYKGARLDFHCRPKEPVLAKIRAEIKGWQDDIHDNENDADEHDFVFERIYEIFDEYKKESEG
jgi:hypothetical protein